MTTNARRRSPWQMLLVILLPLQPQSLPKARAIGINLPPSSRPVSPSGPTRMTARSARMARRSWAVRFESESLLSTVKLFPLLISFLSHSPSTDTISLGPYRSRTFLNGCSPPLSSLLVETAVNLPSLHPLDVVPPSAVVMTMASLRWLPFALPAGKPPASR